MTRKLVWILFLALPHSTLGAEWSITEVQHQLGNLDTPTFAGGGKSWTHSITFQHASGWSFGENFFFFDLTNSDDATFNDADIYSEWYPALSLTRLMGRTQSKRLIREVSILSGLNFGASPRVIKLLPGLRFSLNLPGFAFANLDLMGYLDMSEGSARGGAPSEKNAYIIDFNWALPLAQGKVSVEGHVEYLSSRDNEFGSEVSWHLLAQPQIRLDLGQVLGFKSGTIFVGTEIQFWINKLGDASTDEFSPQTLLVWRL